MNDTRPTIKRMLIPKHSRWREVLSRLCFRDGEMIILLREEDDLHISAAFVDGRLVGWSTAWVAEWHAILMAYVDPPYRGCGIGLAVLTDRMGWVRKMHPDRRLSVIQSDSNWGFFYKAGFAAQKPSPDELARSVGLRKGDPGCDREEENRASS